jgi:uncharacterized protein with PIN domain
MRKTRTQKEQELEAMAKEMIRQLLDWDEEQEKPNLSQMEEWVMGLRQGMGQKMLETLANEQETGEPVMMVCEKCGQEMRNKGEKVKVVESRVGVVELKRDYYYCPACKRGIFPPG